jgi:hypothetical protein
MAADATAIDPCGHVQLARHSKTCLPYRGKELTLPHFSNLRGRGWFTWSASTSMTRRSCRSSSLATGRSATGNVADHAARLWKNSSSGRPYTIRGAAARGFDFCANRRQWQCFAPAVGTNAALQRNEVPNLQLQHSDPAALLFSCQPRHESTLGTFG